MTAPTHILTGLASVVVIGHSIGITPTATSLLAFLIGCLAPDIDGKGSITRPGTILRQLLGRGIGRIIDAVFEAFAAIIQFGFGHRGFIHAPLIALVLLVSGSYFASGSLFWFGLGYLMHIVGDAMTPAGIPLLSPLSSRRFSVCSIKTGSSTEAAVAIGLLLFVAIFGWSLLPQAVQQTHLQLVEAVSMGIQRSGWTSDDALRGP